VTKLPSAGAARLEALVTASLVGLGTDTSAPRHFKARLAEGVAHVSVDRLLEIVEECLGGCEGSRAARLETLRSRARAAVDRAKTLGITIVTAGEPAYPTWLGQIPDPPIVLWVRGCVEWLERPGVAIVGSRRASPAGLASAMHLAREVSRSGLVVTSGLARGIDGAAHRGALDAGGPTVAVLGNGPDLVYPAEHRALSAAILEQGALVSEFPPGTRSFASHFPLRNRIISGLSRAVVVVEANERSGSLITARAALEQGRDVLAVPGPVAGGGHRGCHSLIKDGARLVESVEDILEEIRWARPAAPRVEPGDKDKEVSHLEKVIRPGEIVTLEELAARSGLPGPVLLAALGRLEVAGRIVRMAGGTFARLD
jgi:DNA processing protein